MNSDWTKVYAHNLVFKADIVCGVLEEHNIPNVKLNKKDSSYNVFGEVEVYVHNDHFAKAIELILKMEL